MVDWDLAGRTARRLMSAGPSTTREEAAAVVRELHEAAAVAVAHVEGLTGMRPAPAGPVPEVVVVDRPGWVDAQLALGGHDVRRDEEEPAAGAEDLVLPEDA